MYSYQKPRHVRAVVGMVTPPEQLKPKNNSRGKSEIVLPSVNPVWKTSEVVIGVDRSNVDMPHDVDVQSASRHQRERIERPRRAAEGRLECPGGVCPSEQHLAERLPTIRFSKRVTRPEKIREKRKIFSRPVDVSSVLRAEFAHGAEPLRETV